MDSFVLCGMQFGDEGKGTFVDYLAHEQDVDAIIRYNGGSQASHTVITPSNDLHKFSQLGSGMFSEKCHTYITENMVVNLENLLCELEEFSSKTKIPMEELLGRVHIHGNCYVVTPYHKLINKLREFAKGENRRGTVGTGVSEVMYLLNESKEFPNAPPLGLQVKGLFDLYGDTGIDRMEALQSYVSEFYQKNEEVIWKNVPRDMKEKLRREIEGLLSVGAYWEVVRHYDAIFQKPIKSSYLGRCVYSTYENTLRKTCKKAIYEGSQGILIDGTYGIKPNTTCLDTSINFALDMSYYRDDIKKIGVAKAFYTKHGFGAFPTESSELSEKISDPNQEDSFWMGKIRFGWFDAVLMRYGQRINNVDELYLSSLDKLDDIETIKICNAYKYNGIVDLGFEKTFCFHRNADGAVIITDIKTNGDDLGKYLKECTPIYSYARGWKTKTTGISKFYSLPNECINYVHLLELLVKIPITVVSVGPTRENKIRL